MTTNYHTAFPTGNAANAADVESRYSSLDTQITANAAAIVSNAIIAAVTTAEVVAARDAYASLDARLDALVMAGSSTSTLTNGAASAGQKNITVDSTTGFLAGALIAYTLVGGVIETNTVASITPTTLLVCANNIGTGGIANDTYVMVIPLGSLVSTGALDGASSQQQRFTKGVFLGPNASLVGDDSALLIGRAAVNPLGSGGSHGVRDESTYYYSAGGYASFDANPNAGGAAGMNHVNCFQARPKYSGVGTLDAIWGMTFQPTIAGPITNCYGVYILNPTYDGGDVDGILAGIYINELSGGDLGNYAIYVAGNNLSFLGGGVIAGGVNSFSAFAAAITTAVTDAKGLSIANPSVSGAGAITNVYGVYIGTLSRGESANYALYVEGANTTYLGGDIIIAGALDHNGTTAGFYGVAPTTRQLLATGAGATVDNVITALQTLGLVKQS